MSTDFVNTEILDATTVSFCGERYKVTPGSPFLIGRDGHLAIDDNPYLHRHFLQIHDQHALWWLSNVGSQLTATIADEHGSFQAWLAPGARLPIVFDRTFVWFSAGPTTYEIEIDLAIAPFTPVVARSTNAGQTTIGRNDFTPDQRLLVIALCEPVLLGSGRTASSVPTSAEAAARLDWTLAKFNRKLDNVCQKLARAGVQGLHGGPGNLALNRRARLVEYALATRLIDKSDLKLLDDGHSVQ